MHIAIIDATKSVLSPGLARDRLNNPGHVEMLSDTLQRIILTTLDRDSELRARYLRRRWQGIPSTRCM